MEGLIRFSFFCFVAGTLSVAVSTICYAIYLVGYVPMRRPLPALVGGPSVVSTNDGLWPASVRASAGRFGTMLGWFGVGFFAISVVTRTIPAGRGPYANMYEFSLGFVLAITIIYLLFERAYGIRHLGTIVMALCTGMATYVWMLPAHMREVTTLIPALQNRPLMTIHVSSAILAYATLAVSFAAALLFLVTEDRTVSWLPSGEMLDDISYRAVTVGLPFLTLVLIVGSIWAHQAWGAYWSWDPKETAALCTWLIYSIYLHARTLRQWRGRRCAIILLVGFAAVVFTYFGNYVFGGLHSYGGV